ncbi:phage integrase [Mycolicibacterium conceptionense]|uniref:Phage integrase n=1 Tax=Mycolicibacterium conceptionense TaxID=451644 RepID=A0A0U1DRQ0_9MYCO|nr:tyrosine-type recombinase/integrase [Mycolicibacterium conceptionense]ORV29055.1 hypothetical protein AWB98_06595 [Mycolicibacterium conceptionense]CQD21572.1 phage integrase [Mycolicibacterium conceptionense]
MSASLLRNLRAQARRRGWRVVKTGELVDIWGSDEVIPVISGGLPFVADWLAARMERQQSGPASLAAPEQWRPLLDCYRDELKAAHRTPQTIATRLSHVTTFARWVNVAPADVTRTHLIEYIGRPDRAATTAHGIRASLRDFYAFAIARDACPCDPASDLPAIRQARSRPRPCPDDVARIALTRATDKRVRLAVRVLIETGLRRAEMTRLRPADVIGSAGGWALHVSGKGGDERIVPISDELAGELRDLPSEFVFESARGGPVTPRHLGRLVGAVLPDAWTTHTLRHRFATQAYRATSDLRAVQELLGHSSPTTTAIYTAVADDAMRRAAAAAAL